MCWTASTRSWRPARPSTPPTAPSTTRRWSQRRGDVRSERRVHVDVLKGPSVTYSPKCVEGGFCELRLNEVLRSSTLRVPKKFGAREGRALSGMAVLRLHFVMAESDSGAAPHARYATIGAEE